MSTTIMCNFQSPSAKHLERQTQLSSLEGFKLLTSDPMKVSFQYAKIRRALEFLKIANNNEISWATGIQISSITARVNELRKKQIIIFAGRKLDSRTGVRVMNWTLKNDNS